MPKSKRSSKRKKAIRRKNEHFRRQEIKCVDEYQKVVEAIRLLKKVLEQPEATEEDKKVAQGQIDMFVAQGKHLETWMQHCHSQIYRGRI